MRIDAAVATDLVAPPKKNLPNRILRAIDNALRIGNLPRPLRGTFAAICRFVSQSSPFETVFAKKETIAERFGASVATVYRHLKALKELGLILSFDQERKSRSGRFGIARICLTQRGAEFLELVATIDDVCADAVAADASMLALEIGGDSKETTQPQLLVPVPENAPPSQSEHAPASTSIPVIHTPPHRILRPGHTLTEPTIPKSQPPARCVNGVPVDLAWLSSCGISRAGIFKLMGMATALQKRLSDVATIVRERMPDLRGGRLYAYLARLIAGATDFSMAAADERRRQQQSVQDAAYAAKATLFRERFRNVALTTRSQKRLIVIDATATFARIFADGTSRSTPLHDLRELMRAVECGDLVLATLETQRRFQE